MHYGIIMAVSRDSPPQVQILCALLLPSFSRLLPISLCSSVSSLLVPSVHIFIKTQLAQVFLLHQILEMEEWGMGV